MAVWRGQRGADFGLALMSRRFPPPWSVEETEAWPVKDHTGHSGASSRSCCGTGQPVVQPALQKLQHKPESRRRPRIAATGTSADLEESGL